MSGWVDAKTLQDNLQSLGFTPSLAKPEIKKEVGRQRVHSYEERMKWVKVTRRGGSEALDRRHGIGEDEKQPVMVRLAARWRRSNLVILVTLKKGKHPGEAFVRRGWKKDLYRRERDSLEGPHDEAEIQRKVLKRGKNLAFSEDICLEKERGQSKVTPRKIGVGLKRRPEPSKRRWAGG